MIVDPGFIQSSYSVFPRKLDEINKIGVPIVVSVTPLTENMVHIDLSSSVLKESVKCHKCKAFASKGSHFIPNMDTFTCNLCGTKSGINTQNRLVNETQSSKNDFDIFIPYESNNSHIPSVHYSPKGQVYVVELSQSTYDNGIYLSLIETIESRFLSLDRVNVTIFIINNGLILPNISIDGDKISISHVCDIDNASILPYECVFFSMKTQKKLFQQYIDYIKTLSPKKSDYNIVGLLKACLTIESPKSHVVSVFFSEVTIPQSDLFYEFALESLKNENGVDLYYLINEKFPPNLDPIVEYCMLMNSQFRVFTSDQKLTIPNEILEGSFKRRVYEVTIINCTSPYIELIDIKGCGIRKSSNAYYIETLTVDDTIYFYFNYRKGTIDKENLSIQFQVKFYDSYYNCYVRVLNHSFIVSADPISVKNGINYELFVSGLIIDGIEKARENHNIQSISNEILPVISNKLKNQYLKDLIQYQPQIVSSRIFHGLRTSPVIINAFGLSSVSGKSPQTIFNYLSPLTYRILIDGRILHPQCLSGQTIGNDAFLVRVTDRKAFLIHQNPQELDTWVSLLTKTEINRAIGNTFPGICIEILSMDSKHPIIGYITHCINTSILC